ncbi:uncharacterized protein C2845_PM03G05790 [Panicum miliaceum]|uniref:C2 NT-type domain-containing protein n=1 Tax=Panicum miliaceum TaxID=4540 RepID=A0A3L6TB65_PANMI|nr:uncharacterized protein C2845_PM03G05790 [Panicum miliaceum]
MAEGGKSDDQILNELDALSHTLYQPHSKRRTASLALPRAGGDRNAGGADAVRAEARPLSRRLSMSPFRSRPKLDKTLNDDDDDYYDAAGVALPSKSQSFAAVTTRPSVAGEKKGIWGWRPIRALSRIGMQRMGCLFSVEVVAAQGLPPSMNGLRLAVAVRKKETRDGAVQTMPSRVQQGGADFEEMLFVRCNLYCSGGGATGKPLRFEARPFLISAVAVEAPGLDLGRHAVDLSLLVKESSEKSQQGERVRQWDMAFPLAGKAKGGELIVKLSFQIMDDGGVGLYSQPTVAGRTSSSASSSLFARKHSKSSFSITSPKVARPEPAVIPSKGAPSPDLLSIDDFKLDEPSPVVAEVKQEEQKEPEREAEDEKADDSEFPGFDIVDKGVEGQEEKDEPKEEAEDKKEAEEEEEKEKEEEEEDASAAGGDEVVKEVVVHDSAHTWRLNELEAITNQIKALENMMHSDVPYAGAESPERQEEAPGLDADEEEVTREFLMLLEQGEDGDGTGKLTARQQVSSLKSGATPGSGDDATCYISDLGKGLGPVVQTRDGGYLTSMNPFDIPVERKELPKLAMQLSKPFILRDQKLPGGGAEVFQRLCAGGSEALCAKLGALISMDDVVGKTAEQIAFEGMASAIITARSKEELVASSTTAHSVSLLRTMSMAMNAGRQDRIATGIWYAQEAPVTVDEILAFALQKIETMAIEALKVQADMINDQAPFEVSTEKTQAGHLLDTAAPPEEWESACAGANAVTLLVVVQLRDPLRRYEAIGAPSVVIIQAARAAGSGDDEPRFKVANLHLGGLRLKSPNRRNMWDGEKQRLTAMHWLVAYGLGKAGRKSRAAAAGNAGNGVLWSMSSRVMAGMWLKPLRNPDVTIPQK